MEAVGNPIVAVVEDNAHGLFGKYKGKTIKEVKELDWDYLDWCANNFNGDYGERMAEYLYSQCLNPK